VQQQIWGEVVDFNLAFFQFIWECNSENIIKIGQYLPKLLQEKFGAVFFGPPCISSKKLKDTHTAMQPSSPFNYYKQKWQTQQAWTIRRINEDDSVNKNNNKNRNYAKIIQKLYLSINELPIS